MASLRLANTHNIDYYEYRDKLFYNKYKYKVKVNFPSLREFGWSKNINGWHNTIKRKYPKEQWDELLKYEGVLLQLKQVIDNGVSNRAEGNSISFFFSTNKEAVDFRRQCPSNIDVKIFEAVASNENKVKFFMRKPKYKYRAYMKTRFLQVNERTELKKWLQEREDDIKLSPSFRYWLSRDRYFFLSGSYYIEFDDELLQTYLALSIGEYVNKFYTCKQVEVVQE